MLISFEGLDGSGKTTQAVRLRDRLAAAGYTVHLLREPGGTALGERVRAVLLDPTLTVDPVAEFLLFAASRAQLVAEVVTPALGRGEIVLLDRYIDSSVAYQGYGRGLDPAAVTAINGLATASRLPDVTYWVDVSLATAKARRTARAGSADRMERADDGFHERILTGYRALAAAEPERIVRLDGEQSPDALAAALWADVAPRLPR